MPGAKARGARREEFGVGAGDRVRTRLRAMLLKVDRVLGGLQLSDGTGVTW